MKCRRRWPTYCNCRCSRVRVLVPAIGGGFGGKLRIALEHYAALAGARGRAAGEAGLDLRGGIDRRASASGLDHHAAHRGQPRWVAAGEAGARVMDCGAYAGSGAGTAAVALQIVAGPYRTPNLLLEGFAVYTNKVPTGSFRATAGPMGEFRRRIARWTSSPTTSGSIRWNCGCATWCSDGDTGPAGED